MSIRETRIEQEFPAKGRRASPSFHVPTFSWRTETEPLYAKDRKALAYLRSKRKENRIGIGVAFPPLPGGSAQTAERLKMQVPTSFFGNWFELTIAASNASLI
jgi:hypothetical protein